MTVMREHAVIPVSMYWILDYDSNLCIRPLSGRDATTRVLVHKVGSTSFISLRF